MCRPILLEFFIERVRGLRGRKSKGDRGEGPDGSQSYRLAGVHEVLEACPSLDISVVLGCGRVWCAWPASSVFNESAHIGVSHACQCQISTSTIHDQSSCRDSQRCVTLICFQNGTESVNLWRSPLIRACVCCASIGRWSWHHCRDMLHVYDSSFLIEGGFNDSPKQGMSFKKRLNFRA